jgi:hypothetical protein
VNETETKAALEGWVLANTRIRELDRLPHDYDLIIHRVIDSLQFVELVLFVEELSAKSIDIDSIELREFSTIDSIWSSFFA